MRDCSSTTGCVYDYNNNSPCTDINEKKSIHKKPSRTKHVYINHQLNKL